MPDSSVVTFADPDAYHEALGYAQVQAVVTAHGKFRAGLTRVELHRLSVHCFSAPRPRYARAGVSARDGKIQGISGIM